MNTITIIIVSYNSGEIITKCLVPLLNSKELSVIIVDNASTDGTVRKLKEIIPHCNFIVMDKNLGYGRAANVALKSVKTTHALLINPDIQISSQQIKVLLKKTDDFSKAAIFAPATSLKHKKLEDQPIEQEEVSGSCMLFDMKKLSSIGFFDENIFLFSEETDLCTRVRQAGLKIILFPEIYVKHLGKSSSGSSNDINYLKNWHFGWSRSYYYQKYQLDNGKKSLNRRLLQYRWKKLIARDNYRKIKFCGICDGIIAFKRGEKAFTQDGYPQMHLTSSKSR